MRVLLTFGVLRFYSLSLVFYSVYAVFNKIFYSLNKIKILLGITIAGLLIKLILNFLLIDLEQNGLALSTSISFMFFFLASYIFLNIKLKIKDRLLFAKDFINAFDKLRDLSFNNFVYFKYFHNYQCRCRDPNYFIFCLCLYS